MKVRHHSTEEFIVSILHTLWHRGVESAVQVGLYSSMQEYIHLYSPERQQQQVKKAPNTQQKQTNKREKKNYAQIGQASEQCYHQRTLKTYVNQR